MTRTTALGWVVVLVALDGCGGKAERRDGGEGHARSGGGASGASPSGGIAGSSGASASGGGGRGGSKGMTGGDGGTASGEGGESGAGGEPGAGGNGGESGIRFVLLEPPPPLAFPPGATDASEREDGLAITGASRDGSVLAGVFWYRYPDFDAPEHGEAFVWTEAQGVVRLRADALPGRRPLAIDFPSLSADGTRLLGRYEQRHERENRRVFGGFFSWSQAEGMREAFVLPDVVEAMVDFVSDDARAAVGVYRASDDFMIERPLRIFRFTETGGAGELGSAQGLPEAIFVSRMSPDGRAVLVNSDDGAPPRAFRYDETDGARPLGALDGFPECRAELMSDDAAIIVGSCSNGAASRAFRWTETGGMVALDGVEASDSVQAMSADGSVLVGTSFGTTGLDALFRWTEQGGKETFAAPRDGLVSLEPHSLTSDGHVAFGWLIPREGSDVGAPGTEAFRWSDTAGIEPLGFLSGDEVSEAFTATSDGAVLGGASHPAYVLGRAVLWDRHGIRDVTKELDDAGVDRHGSEPSFVHRVWSSPTTLVVQGTDSLERSWVAWLPRRD